MHIPIGIRTFISVWLIYSLALLIPVLTIDRFELHRAMHPFTPPWMDVFFHYVTHLADGTVPTVLSLVILFRSTLRSFLMMGVGCSFGALVTQWLKHVPFSDSDRPFMFKEQLGDLHWLSDVVLHHHNSFPSGHATAAFNMCFALVVLFPGRWRGLLLGMLAVLLAYSRVYLSQHFTVDILVGASIGTMTSFVVYWWLYESRFAQRAWFGKRLLGHRNQ